MGRRCLLCVLKIFVFQGEVCPLNHFTCSSTAAVVYILRSWECQQLSCTSSSQLYHICIVLFNWGAAEAVCLLDTHGRIRRKKFKCLTPSKAVRRKGYRTSPKDTQYTTASALYYARDHFQMCFVLQCSRQKPFDHTCNLVFAGS